MQLVCTQTSNGGAKNTSTIKWTLSTHGSSDTYYSTGPTKVVINGTTVYSKDRVDWSSGSFPAIVGSKSGELTVSHKDDGTKSIKVSFSTAIYTSTVSTYSDTWELDAIPRYATVKQSLNSKTETSIKIDWSSDSVIDTIKYSTDNGSTWTSKNVTDGKSGTYTITKLSSDTTKNLSANTTYKVKTQVHRKDSGLTTNSSALSVTTYNYPYCTSSPNFILGNAVTLSFYNPLKRAFSFYIIGNGKEIDVEYKCSGTTYIGVNSTTNSVPYLYATIPNNTSGKYKVKVVYTDSNSVAHTFTRDTGNTYTIKGTECYPDFSTFTFKDTNDTITKLVGGLVKGLSSVTVEIPAANRMTTKNSATPKSYGVSVDTISKSVNNPTDTTSAVTIPLGVINSAGSKRLSVSAVDSRSLVTQVSKDVTVYDYAKPVINVSAKRLNNFEAQTTLKVSGTYSKLTVRGTDKNTITNVEYRYREASGNWGSWTTLTTTLSSGNFACNNVMLSLDNAKAFEFEIRATDKLYSTTKLSTVDIGQAVFMVSSNKKTAYLNGEEVTTRDNSRQTKYYTQLSQNTDLNEIKEIGTYRSTQKADSDTMKNLPPGIDGGFVMYVVTWTATPTNTEYRRQELIYGRMSYVRRSIDSGSTWSEWNTVAYLEDIYPVGAVYCTSTNSNPASKLGGTWELIDKGYKSYYLDDATIFSPATNVTTEGCVIVRSDHTIRVRLRIKVNKAMSDTGTDLGSLNWSKVGVTSLPMGFINLTSYSDVANAGIVYNVAWDTGLISQNDVFNASSIGSGESFYIEFVVNMVATRMLDSACDKFYWQRTE